MHVSEGTVIEGAIICGSKAKINDTKKLLDMVPIVVGI